MSLSGLCTSFGKVILFSLPEVFCGPQICQNALAAGLDLSAAFDCVDHAILLQRLEVVFGIMGTVLDWIRSFLTDRTQQVAYCSQLSSVRPMLFGVPQG